MQFYRGPVLSTLINRSPRYFT